MPAHINYETTPIIFYKFICENPEIKSCYVGHTTNFNRRKAEHKSCCNNNKSANYEDKKYKIMRENGGWDKWKMVEINRQLCLDKINTCKIEQQYIEELQSDMNMINSYTNNVEYKKKYKLENKEQISEKNKSYRLKNLKKIADKNKQKFDCDCGGKYTYVDKSTHLKTLKHLKYCENIVNI